MHRARMLRPGSGTRHGISPIAKVTLGTSLVPPPPAFPHRRPVDHAAHRLQARSGDGRTRPPATGAGAGLVGGLAEPAGPQPSGRGLAPVAGPLGRVLAGGAALVAGVHHGVDGHEPAPRASARSGRGASRPAVARALACLVAGMPSGPADVCLAAALSLARLAGPFAGTRQPRSLGCGAGAWLLLQPRAVEPLDDAASPAWCSPCGREPGAGLRRHRADGRCRGRRRTPGDASHRATAAGGRAQHGRARRAGLAGRGGRRGPRCAHRRADDRGHPPPGDRARGLGGLGQCPPDAPVQPLASASGRCRASATLSTGRLCPQRLRPHRVSRAAQPVARGGASVCARCGPPGPAEPPGGV